MLPEQAASHLCLSKCYRYAVFLIFSPLVTFLRLLHLTLKIKTVDMLLLSHGLHAVLW